MSAFSIPFSFILIFITEIGFALKIEHRNNLKAGLIGKQYCKITPKVLLLPLLLNQ